jgi:hypothetical protein
MTSFLFWNIKNNPIESIIARLALRHEIDVIMLAECNIAPYILLSELKEYNGSVYKYIPSDVERIKIFARFSEEDMPAVMAEDKFTIRHLKLPETDILISIVHLPIKLHKENDDQIEISRNLSTSIREAEEIIGHTRTVVFGDLNMSPFDNGVVRASGLNATMSRDIAQEKTRRILKEDYLFFYNPMWNFIGDFNSNPPGTYYYSKATQTNLRWYMFDQVLIRPDLLDYFDIQDLKILTSDGNTNFLSKRGIPRIRISDHLPLIFKLDL